MEQPLRWAPPERISEQRPVPTVTPFSQENRSLSIRRAVLSVSRRSIPIIGLKRTVDDFESHAYSSSIRVSRFAGDPSRFGIAKESISPKRFRLAAPLETRLHLQDCIVEPRQCVLEHDYGNAWQRPKNRPAASHHSTHSSRCHFQSR